MPTTNLFRYFCDKNEIFVKILDFKVHIKKNCDRVFYLQQKKNYKEYCVECSRVSIVTNNLIIYT